MALQSATDRRRFLAQMGALSLLSQGPGGSPQAKAAAKEYAGLATRRFRKHIDGARKAILDEIKPTPAQLERGLELHRESIVCDLYGGTNPVHVTGFYSESMKAWALDVLDREPDPERKRNCSCSPFGRKIQKWRALEVVHDPGFQANHRLAWETSQVDLGLADVAWAPEGKASGFPSSTWPASLRLRPSRLFGEVPSSRGPAEIQEGGKACRDLARRPS